MPGGVSLFCYFYSMIILVFHMNARCFNLRLRSAKVKVEKILTFFSFLFGYVIFLSYLCVRNQ